MLDTRSQERCARRCTDAAFGYTAATTAAYAAFADQVFDFWAGVLEPPRREPPTPQPNWAWPMMPMLPMATTAPAPRRDPTPAPFLPFVWGIPAPSRPAPPANAFAGAQAAFSAWLGMFQYYGVPSPAWPMACMMMASGVPRSVAVPTAEANIAVMEAAEAATSSVQQVLASYRSDGGHAVTRPQWPAPNLMMLAMLAPFNVGAVLNSLRVA
jgi:hypothetical protein